MKFTYTVEIDTDRDSPELIGELLRSRFWDPSKGYGCYSNFDWAPEVKPLPPRIDEYEDNFWSGDHEEPYHVKEEWQRAEWNGIICEYYWDGDGFLRFIFPDGNSLFNDDCKKASYWNWE